MALPTCDIVTTERSDDIEHFKETYQLPDDIGILTSFIEDFVHADCHAVVLDDTTMYNVYGDSDKELENQRRHDFSSYLPYVLSSSKWSLLQIYMFEENMCYMISLLRSGDEIRVQFHVSAGYKAQFGMKCPW